MIMEVIELINTKTGKKALAEVSHRKGDYIVVFLATEKITLTKNNNGIYIGNIFGMELVYDPRSGKLS